MALLTSPTLNCTTTGVYIFRNIFTVWFSKCCITVVHGLLAFSWWHVVLTRSVPPPPQKKIQQHQTATVFPPACCLCRLSPSLPRYTSAVAQQRLITASAMLWLTATGNASDSAHRCVCSWMSPSFQTSLIGSGKPASIYCFLSPSASLMITVC